MDPSGERDMAEGIVRAIHGIVEKTITVGLECGDFLIDDVQEIECEAGPYPNPIIDRRWVVLKDGRSMKFESSLSVKDGLSITVGHLHYQARREV